MEKHYLMCWEENGEKRWNMIHEKDFDAFGLNLLNNPNVNNHTIFIIPCSGFIEGVWLSRHTHKSGRVDFWNFFEDYGTPYVPPVVKEENKDTLQTLHERNDDGTKYGWISPDGKYFHCGYQGHVALAEKICFGMIIQIMRNVILKSMDGVRSTSLFGKISTRCTQARNMLLLMPR